MDLRDRSGILQIVSTPDLAQDIKEEYVLEIEGEVKKGTSIEVFRSDTLIGKGKLINLQRDKKDTDKVIKGQDCGILCEGDAKIEEGDILVVYTEERRKGEI